MHFRIIRTYLAVGAAALAVGCASEVNPVTGQKQQVGFSWAQERELGAKSDKEIVDEMGLYDNPALQAYVSALGERLLQHTELRGPNAAPEWLQTNFTFRVVSSPEVNAFAIPGGYVYVTRGLLAHVQNEAQLAVVMGHEIGHVAARHSARQAVRSQWTQLAAAAAGIGGAIVGQKMGVGDDMLGSLMKGVSTGAQAYILHYDRAAETEADSLGVRYASGTGYSTAEAAKFFHSLERLSDSAGQKIPTWQSTHPDPGDRAQKLVQMSQPGGNVGEEQFLQKIDGLVVGDDPREGFVENGTFFHPGLRFQFPVPGGWQVQNEPSVVVMAEPKGGAMLGFQMAQGTSAQQAASDFAQKSGLQNASASQTRMGRNPAVIVTGQGNTEQGVVAVWSAFVEMDGHVYNFLGYTGVQNFNQFQRLFESVAQGLDTVRDNRILSVQPAHLALIKADRPAPFSTFVPRNLPKGLTAEQLAIMNQVEMNETVPAGRVLKLPK